MDDQVAPYPPAEPGTKLRRIPFPVGAPDRTPKPSEPVIGSDGKPRPDGHLTGLAVRRPVAGLDDLGVSDWSAWP